MSKGSITNKDRRSETRNTQRQQRNREAQREQARRKRGQRIIQSSLVAGGVVLFAVILYFVINANSTNSSSNAGPKVIDGIACQTSEGAVTHIHTALKMYVNGQQSPIPAGIGINNAPSCLYALHTHATNNIIHVEAPDQKTYTLGQFFDIWGQPLSRTQVANNNSDATNGLTFAYFDANGKLIPYTGDPRVLPLADHETVVVLYNSPTVHPTPFTDWQSI